MSAGSLEARTRDIAHRLVGWPSVTGTPDEIAFAARLAEDLAAHPYFRQNPGDLTVRQIPGEAPGRSNILALVRASAFPGEVETGSPSGNAHKRSSGSRTVILSGHFDVVPVDDYTDLAPLAGSPEALRKALIERLEALGGHEEALDDLASGDFVPGRGMLDMKSGLAAGIAVLEQFAEEDGRVGNLLLIATPDEEENSCGMRAVADLLPAYLAENGLDCALAINLDATCDTGDGRDGRVATMGTIGKLLVSAYVVGRDSHACYPFDGVNSAYLAAELACEFECAPELAEIGAAPPTILSLKDQKAVYNVTTPGRSWLFWNVLVHRRSPAAVFAIARTLAERAVSRAAHRIGGRAAALDRPATPTETWSAIRIVTFAEVFAAARDTPGFTDAYEREAARLAESDLDLPTRSRILTEAAWQAAGLEEPAIVLGVASMPYPSVAWPESAKAAATERLVEAAMATISDREGVSIEKRAFFPAISDMSFLGAGDRADLRETAANTPLWGSSIRWNIEAETAHIPVVNIGPWGRDYHHWLERAHADYTFRILPELVREVARNVLSQHGLDEE